MKFKKVFKLILVTVISLTVVGTVGLSIWSQTGTYPAHETAINALKATDTVIVTQDPFITFAPTAYTETGLIFYPGGLVEPAAYAPVLHQLAEEGVLAVIAPMPFNLAIFKTGAANAVMHAYPDITRWILAGHSLGGAAAAIYAENHPEKIDAIAFWDSYPPNSSDLSDNSLSVLSIYGTMDNFPNTENFDSRRHLVPADTRFVAIEGASHAQFGDYGPQKDDVTAKISLGEQHKLVTCIMLDFIFPD